MTLGINQLKIRFYNEENEEWGSDLEFTPELAKGVNDKIITQMAMERLIDILNEGLDRNFDYRTGDIEAIHNQKAWEKIKNINTDEELEEIGELLGVRDED